MGTIAFYVLVEILPILIVVDSNFMDAISDIGDQDLIEPLFNTSRISGITNLESRRDLFDNTRSAIRYSPGGLSNKSFSDTELMFH